MSAGLVGLIVLAVLFLAYSNGANDNFKGVATLFGSGVTNYRRALAWATVTTFAGSLLALVLAEKLVKSFQGLDLVGEEVAVQPAFVLAASFGAALTVMLATLTGLPVSTTHALLGGLVGAGLVAANGDVKFAARLIPTTNSALPPLTRSSVVTAASSENCGFSTTTSVASRTVA